MPLPSPGSSISFSQVNSELGLTSTGTINLNNSRVRHMFNKYGSGSTIGMSDGRGKSFVRWIGFRYYQFVSGSGQQYKTMYSIDGASFTDTGTFPFFSSTPSYAASSTTRFVVPKGGYHNQVAVTTDGGANWSTGTLPSSNYWGPIAFGNGNFVMVSGGSSASTSLYSSDGISWSASSALATTGYWAAIDYTPNGFWAVQQNGRISYSTNGSSWSSGTQLTVPSSGGFVDCGYGNGVYMILSTSSSGQCILRSTDGTNFSTTTLGYDNIYQVLSYAGGSTWFISSTSGGTTSTTAGYRSTDNGVSWSAISCNVANTKIQGVATFINSSRIVSTGIGTDGNAQYLLYSSDSGANFTATGYGSIPGTVVGGNLYIWGKYGEVGKYKVGY